MSAPVPLSILDLVVVPEGRAGGDVVRASVAAAQRAEQLGYARYWFGEHHLAPGSASAAPIAGAAAVAAATTRIRVGSAAVLMSHTSPIQAVEQFATLAWLHPGRIDLGLGRGAQVTSEEGKAAELSYARTAVGSPARVGDLTIPAPAQGAGRVSGRGVARFRALRGHRDNTDFAGDVDAVLALLGGDYRDDDGNLLASALAGGADLQPWVLASSASESARLAASRGLPLAVSFHSTPATAIDAAAEYRRRFVPGALDEPLVVSTAWVVTADTAAEARRLASGYEEWLIANGREGAHVRYPAPGRRILIDVTAQERETARPRVSSAIVGAPGEVAAQLRALRDAAQADELVVTTAVHDTEARMRSFELLADAWGLPT